MRNINSTPYYTLIRSKREINMEGDHQKNFILTQQQIMAVVIKVLLVHDSVM